MTSSAEKFEILSAYLDNEASLEECRLVEQWLDCDPLFRQQYQAQLRLKSAIRSLSALEQSVPPCSIDPLPISHRPLPCTPLSETDSKFDAKGKTAATSYTAIARWGKEFIILVTVVFSAASLATFSHSALKRSSKWKRLRRSSILSNAANAPSHRTFQSAVESH